MSATYDLADHHSQFFHPRCACNKIQKIKLRLTVYDILVLYFIRNKVDSKSVRLCFEILLMEGRRYIIGRQEVCPWENKWSKANEPMIS